MLTDAELKRAVESFSRSLGDLTVNSKPHINFLTMVAEENSIQAEAIVNVVNNHLKKVPCIVKLPVFYLIDSIMKNVGKDYIRLFSPVLLDCFANIYAEADKATRQLMEKLRQTWNGIISPKDLSTLDVQVHALDPEWRLTAESIDALKNTQIKILLNPNFLPQMTETNEEPKTPQKCEESGEDDEAEVLREQLLLQKRMRELEKEQKQVDLQLSKMKEKIILVDNLKKCASDTLCDKEAKEETSNTTIINVLDEEKSERQADSTTVDKVPNVPTLGCDPTASTTKEVGHKQLNGDLLLFLADLIAKQNDKVKKQGQENHMKYQEHRSQFREYSMSDTRNCSRNSESRSYGSSYYRSRNKSSDRHRSYASWRESSDKYKYYCKKVELQDYECERKSRLKHPSYRSSPKLSSRKDNSIQDSKQHDGHQRTVSSRCKHLSNLSVEALECTQPTQSSQPECVIAKEALPFESKERHDINRPHSSPKRKLQLAELDSAPQSKTPCVNIIPVQEKKLPLLGRNPNFIRNSYNKKALLPTPNIEPSHAVLESFSHIRFVQSYRSTPDDTNDSEVCLSSEGLSYTHHTRKFSYAAKFHDQLRNGPTEIQLQREIDYNHGLGCPENKQLVECSISGSQSRNEQPLHLDPLTSPHIEINPKVYDPAFSSWIDRQQELRQEFSDSGHQEPSLKEDTENSCRTLQVNQVLTMTSPLVSLPPVSHYILSKIAHDTMRTILVDNSTREVRFYGEIALIDSEGSNPREILFKPGEASIIVNNFAVDCTFHGPHKEVTIGGRLFRVRLGAPTRELFVNDEGFQCPFNCLPKKIKLSTGEVLAVQLHSNNVPLVHIGAERRDLVAGSVFLSVDSKHSVQIFLDAKPQRFDVDGVPHILKFADALQTVLVNDYPVDMHFGGLPIVINVNDTKHYIQLSGLPPGVIPGEVSIISMAWVKDKPREKCFEPLSVNVMQGLAVKSVSFQKKKRMFKRTARGKGKGKFFKGSSFWKTRNPSYVTAAMLLGDRALGLETKSGFESALCTSGHPVNDTKINVHALFQSLCNVGLVTPQRVLDSPAEIKSPQLKIHFVDFKEPASLKQKQPSIVETLYSGLQCSSCGSRFSKEHPEVYREHLDWHFRQNHKFKCLGKCHSRLWYCNRKVWIPSEEATYGSQTEAERKPCVEKISSVPSHGHPQSAVCEMCGEEFEEFFHEDEDEWHFRDCVLQEGLVYHSFCFKDYQLSRSVAAKPDTQEENNAANADLKDEQHTGRNLANRETSTEAVGDNNAQVPKACGKVSENSQRLNDTSSVMTPEQEVLQEPDKIFSHRSDIENQVSSNICSDKNETPHSDPWQSGCNVTGLRQDTENLTELNDFQTIASHCIYSSLEAAASSPPSKQDDVTTIKPFVVCDESIKESDATISKENVWNVWSSCLTELSSGEMVRKPKLIGRKLITLPPAVKGSETSNMCSLS